MNFDNLHQILRTLYTQMMPLCGDMIGVAKGIAGLGALFYVASRVWQALSRAEPIDVYPLLRPFAIGLCIMFFPTIVLGTINAVMSPVVTGCNKMLQTQTLNLNELKDKRDKLEYEARLREGKAWLVDDEAYDAKLKELDIWDSPQIISMWGERSLYQMKKWLADAVRWLLELLFNASALIIDVIRTFFLVVLSILGPLAFALSVYDGFQATLTQWIARYISIYLWLPISDLFSSILARIQVLMIDKDIQQLDDPTFIPDGSDAMYLIFMLMGIVGYFTIPTVAGWIIQSGGAGGATGAMNKGAAMAGGVAGSIAGNAAGRAGAGAKSIGGAIAGALKKK